MPNLLPQLLRAALSGSGPAPISMYLRSLFGGGAPMRTLPKDLTAALRDSYWGDPASEAYIAEQAGIESPDPFNLSAYSLGTNDGMPIMADEGLHLRAMRDPTNPLFLQRTLGSFRATPVGRDSVRIRDRYDFEDDPAGPLGRTWSTTSPFIGLSQLAGQPYEIDATIAAPALAAQLRAREMSFREARRLAMKEQLHLLKGLK